MSKTYAIVESNTVVNVVAWDGESPWTPPQGAEAVHAPEGCAIGWIYNGVGFDEPPPPPEPPKPTAEELKAQLDALNAQLAQIQRLLANT